jgi:hypothetical protein
MNAPSHVARCMSTANPGHLTSACRLQLGEQPRSRSRRRPSSRKRFPAWFLFGLGRGDGWSECAIELCAAPGCRAHIGCPTHGPDGLEPWTNGGQRHHRPGMSSPSIWTNTVGTKCPGQGLWGGLITQRSRVQIPSPRRSKGLQAVALQVTYWGNAPQAETDPPHDSPSPSLQGIPGKKPCPSHEGLA